MDNPLVKWTLIIIVLVVWINMVRVSIPTIVNYFKEKTETTKSEISTLTTEDGNIITNNNKPRNIYNLKNPFKEPFLAKENKLPSQKNRQPQVFSYFRLKGIFLANGKKTAILEGKQEFGVNGIFYVIEGDILMGEKIVEISDNYIIINKEGKDITLTVE
jgi:hypothetical protein